MLHGLREAESLAAGRGGRAMIRFRRHTRRYDGALGIIAGIAAVKSLLMRAAARAGASPELLASAAAGGPLPTAVREAAQVRVGAKTWRRMLVSGGGGSPAPAAR